MTSEHDEPESEPQGVRSDDGQYSDAQLRGIALVAGIMAGNARSEEELVALYSRGIRYLLQHLTRDRELADDLFQETFRIALTKIRDGEVRQPEHLSAFLRGIARNLWVGEWRKRRRRPNEEPVDGVAEIADPTPGALGEVVLSEDRQRVRQLLQEMASQRDREVLFRFYIAEEPKEALCASLGMSTGQLNLVLFRARQRFRRLLEAQTHALPRERG